MAERDPLNFFSPYERLPAGHENQLTRALLLLLRMSPLAHIEWLRLVDPARSLRALPPPEFATQRRGVRDAESGGEPASLVSVFLAPERPLSGGGDVVESDRGQVLDAIIDYGELVTVIENKVFEAGDLQAREINLRGASVQLVDGQEVVIVVWRDLLEALLDDFLAYVEDHFPDLGPFRTLALCAGIPSRLERRLRQILGDAAAGEAESSPSGPRVATPAGAVAGRDAYLTATGNGEVQLALYPADTLGQAAEFFSRPAAVAGALRLDAAAGWTVKPNFHFGHMQRGFCWTTSDIALEDYLLLWEGRIATEASIGRDQWDAYWAWLLGEGIAGPRTPRVRPYLHRNGAPHGHASPGTLPVPGLASGRGRSARWPGGTHRRGPRSAPGGLAGGRRAQSAQMQPYSSIGGGVLLARWIKSTSSSRWAFTSAFFSRSR